MAYKTSFILSLIFVIQLLLIIGDVFTIQVLHARLDALALTAGYWISQRGAITEDLLSFLDDRGATFTCVSHCQPTFGQTVEFTLSRMYDPLIISDSAMMLVVTHYSVVGYYY